MPVINVAGYQLSEQIGEGAFSKVYRGVVSKATKVHALHQRVAIKVIQIPSVTSSGESAGYKKKILKEVKLHKMLSHRNILRLLDYSEHEGESIWIVLEYADGGDLFDKITPDLGITEQLAHLYFYQLIAALNYCHSSGVVHRDVKPENMLLDHAGNLKLADFGLAELYKWQGKEKKCVEACGSAPYAAPELALGQPYRAQPVDVWSAGVVLFTLLVGNTPWDQPTSASPEYDAYISGDILSQDPWTRLPPELLSLMMGVMKPNPKERALISDIAQHSWFQTENPLMKNGQVLDSAVVWNELFQKLEEGGEFAIKSSFSDSSNSGSGIDSQMSTQASQQLDSLPIPILSYTPAPHNNKPSPTMPMSSMQRSQGRSRDVFNDISNEMDVEMSQTKYQIDSMAKEAISRCQASMPILPAVLAGTVQGTATQYSQVGSYAPSQKANPNITRFFTYHSLPQVVRYLEAALNHLKFENVPEANERGHAIRFRGRDTRGQLLSGKVSIDYEATTGDFEAAEADTSYRDLAKMRPGALTAISSTTNGEDNDMTVQPGMQMAPSTVPKKGQGEGGYVVSMSAQGDPLEKKRLFTKIERLVPAGLVLAR